MCMRYLWGVQAHGRPLTFVEFHESDELSLYTVVNCPHMLWTCEGSEILSNTLG